MADAVTSQTLYDGPDKVIMKFTNVSDGTGESTVKKVDASTFSPAATSFAIQKILYATDGMGVNILFDATTDDMAWTIPQNVSGVLDFGALGIVDPRSSGFVGDILFTTVGHSSGDRYSVELHLRKIIG